MLSEHSENKLEKMLRKDNWKIPNYLCNKEYIWSLFVGSWFKAQSFKKTLGSPDKMVPVIHSESLGLYVRLCYEMTHSEPLKSGRGATGHGREAKTY